MNGKRRGGVAFPPEAEDADEVDASDSRNVGGGPALGLAGDGWGIGGPADVAVDWNGGSSENGGGWIGVVSDADECECRGSRAGTGCPSASMSRWMVGG